MTNDYHPSDEDDPLHQAALYLISRIKEIRAMPEVTKADSEIYSGAVYALGIIGDFTATDLLLSLAEGVTNTHGGPIGALAALGDPETFDFFVNMIYDEKYHDSGPCGWVVPVALARIGDKRAVPHLLRALETHSFQLSSIIMALGELGDERAVPEIGEYFKTGYHITTSSACRALRKIGGLAAKQLLWGLADEAAGASPEYSPLYKRELLAKKYSYDGSISGLPLSVTEYEDGRPVRTIDVRKELSKCDRRETMPGYEERYFALRELAKMGDERALGEFILHIRKGLSFSKGKGHLSNKYRLDCMFAWGAELKAITGQDFGEDIDAWERWWRRGGGKKR